MTAGYDAEPGEVETLFVNLCGDIMAKPDPLIRYHSLTREQALYDALVSAIKRRRGLALAEMVTAERQTQGAIAAKQAVAEAAGLGTRQRVEQLIGAANG